MVVCDATRLSLIGQLGDEKTGAWETFDQVYRPMILRWLSRYVSRLDDAEDLTQEVMLVLTRKVSEFEHNGRVGAFRTWIRCTAANVARNHLRSANRHVPATRVADVQDGLLSQLAESDSEVSRAFDAEHDRLVVARLLEKIQNRFEPETLEMFRRAMLEELPAAEVARDLGVSPVAVRIAKSRVLRELRAVASEWVTELSLS